MFFEDLSSVLNTSQAIEVSIREHRLNATLGALSFDSTSSELFALNNDVQLQIQTHSNSIGQLATNLSLAYPNNSRDCPSLCNDMISKITDLTTYTLSIETSSSLISQSLLTHLMDIVHSVTRLCQSLLNLKLKSEPTYLRDTGVVWSVTKPALFNAPLILHSRISEIILLLNDASSELVAYIESDEWYALVQCQKTFTDQATHLMKRVKLSAIVCVKVCKILENTVKNGVNTILDAIDTVSVRLQSNVDDVVCDVTCAEGEQDVISTNSIDHFMKEVVMKALMICDKDTDREWFAKILAIIQ